MTTKKVVADGRSDAEIRGLVQVKANELTRRILEGVLNLDWALRRTQDVIEGPDGFEEMIHIPLEWDASVGRTPLEKIHGNIARSNKRCRGGWRLPTHRELSRAMRKAQALGFVELTDYWTSTPHFDGRGLTVVYNHGQGLGARSHFSSTLDPILRLCRPVCLDFYSY